MLEWLVLIGLIAALVNFSRRLKLAEAQLMELAGREFAYPAASPPLPDWPDEAPADAQPEAPPQVEWAAPEPSYELHGDTPSADTVEEFEYAAADHEPSRPRFAMNFEELFGRRLPIWAGGITLAIAGMLIVKLSIDSGLMTPPVRVIAGLLFGAVLIGAAELARRNEERVRDARVRQALAGAGIASLYASILVATNLYALVGPAAAMVAMAAVTALALLLAIRFGAPSALLGLAGGLAAPALIGSAEPNVPLLSLYLALAVGGLCTLSRNQRWLWLGVSALVGGFGWGLLLLLGGALDAPGSISVGLYLLLLGVAVPALGFAGDWRHQLQLIAGIAAAAQMAALVATGGFALLNWGLFGLLALASQWLARRDAQLVRLPAVGALIALLLLGAWPNPDAESFALVLSGVLLIYGVPAALRLWSPAGGLVEAGQLAALVLGGLLLPMLHFYAIDGSRDFLFGLLASGLAGAAGALAWAGALRQAVAKDARFAILATVSALLAAAAATLLAPEWLMPAAVAAVGLALLEVGRKVVDERLESIAWLFAAAGTLLLPLVQSLDGLPVAHLDALRWALIALVAGAFAWRGGVRGGRAAAQALVPVFAFAASAPLVADRFEPLVPPLLMLASAWAATRLLRDRLVWPMAASAALIALFAMPELLFWSVAATASVTGSPMLVGEVPQPEPAVLRLLIPALLAAASLWVASARLRIPELRAGIAFVAVLAAVAVHSLYKLLFAIDSPEAFAAYGLAERTLWQALLIGAAAAAFRFGVRYAALAFAGAAAAHLSLYSLLLHNPLWAEQAVGPVPVANLLLPVYVLAFALVIAAKRWLPLDERNTRALGFAQMILVLLFAFSTLRQLFHGSLLVAPGLPPAEDIARSILAIALAIGFLLWGIARRQRDWRIASLVLMLAAVAKVFLMDASGLEGVTRIASFVALGLSLIGIGWLYARHLGTGREPAAA